MNGNLYVNTAGLKEVADSIKIKKEKINEIYQNEVLNALKECEEYFKVSGLNYEDVSKSFNAVFSTLDTRLSDLVTILTGTIIPKYEQTSNVVANLFNSDFAEKMQSILSKMN